MYMHEETKHMSTFNDIPVLLARIDDKLGIIAAWIQNGASQQDPHAILTIDEAVAFTGYSKSAIHSATSKDTIPHFKRGNKLFFFKDELVECAHLVSDLDEKMLSLNDEIIKLSSIADAPDI